MISRRKLLGMLGAGALIAPQLLIAKRTIFLPPIGGWPHGRIAHASLIVPRNQFSYGWWDQEIASGRMAYDPATEVLSLLEFDEDRTGAGVTQETMRTPGEYVIAEDIIADEQGNFCRGGTLPIRYQPMRAQADDAREAAIREKKLRERRELHPSLPGFDRIDVWQQ